MDDFESREDSRFNMGFAESFCSLLNASDSAMELFDPGCEDCLCNKRFRGCCTDCDGASLRSAARGELFGIILSQQLWVSRLNSMVFFFSCFQQDEKEC